MALTTLPYPNMDFTPLDILTADELDHIVANYTAINNATISPSIFSDGSIAMSKVDWSTATNGTSYFKIGRLGICWGTITATVGQRMDNFWADATVNFPITYSVAPTATFTAQAFKREGEAQPYHVTVNTNSVSTTSSSISIERLWYGGTVTPESTTVYVNWIAIGLLPE